MNKIFKTTLVLVSLIAGFGYAEKARYDNEDEEMEYDNNPGEIKEEFKEEFKEETHRIYRTFFEKRRYGIKVAVNFPPVMSKEDIEIGDELFGFGIGIITSIPVSEDGPFKIESGIELYEVFEYGDEDGVKGYEVIRIPVLLDYYPLGLTMLSATTLGGDGRIVMLHFKGGVFFDWKYDYKDLEDDRNDIKSISFDSPGVIFTLGFKAHKDGTKILGNHLAMETGISYKNNFKLDVNFFYLF